MLAAAPKIATAVQRDKEEEMIHRGAQYARAVKKYYKKFGRYPASIEALENTNNMRFLRRRYKDPFSPDGKWQMVRFGQVQFGAAQRQGGGDFSGAGQPGLPNVPGVTNMLQGQPTQANPAQQGGSTFGGGTTAQPQSSGSQPVGGSFSQFGSSNQQSGGSTFGQPTNSNQPGTAQGQPDSGGQPVGGSFGQSGANSANQVFGGGAIIGVSSSSERKSIRVIADKDHYKDWKFVYDPTFDRGNLINGPYDPKKQMGQMGNMGGQQLGQPIGQPQQGTGSSFGGGSFGQPQQNPMQPYQPPDQPVAPNNPR
jgi:hypothetical protein